MSNTILGEGQDFYYIQMYRKFFRENQRSGWYFNLFRRLFSQLLLTVSPIGIVTVNNNKKLICISNHPNQRYDSLFLKKNIVPIR